MNHPSIIVQNITAKWQGDTVLNDVSFTVSCTDHLLICGASGSGKTILAKAIIGKLFHNGEVKFEMDGKSITPSIVFVQQHYHFRNLSNVESFYYQQRFNSFDGDDAQTVLQEIGEGDSEFSLKVDELLQQFDLAHRANEPLLHLSSGEHKRFQLIKALLKNPSVIILDEPFTGLDIQTRNVLKQHLDTLAANGTAVIVICKPEDAPSCITHILEIDKGLILQLVKKSGFHFQKKVANLSVLQSPAEEVNASFVNAVLLNNVSVSYGNKSILKQVSWKVRQGEKWLVKGRNGAGKSTLLSLITGDNPQAYANDIYLFDKKRGTGESIWDIKKQIGYVSPELQWYFDTNTTCFSAVASGFFDTIGLFRQVTEAQKQKALQWLQYFGLQKHANQTMSLLPAGKQRLVLLARAMVKNPPVLILDEPCQGLDDVQKEHFIGFADAICSGTNRTLIYVSHYASEIPSCISKVLELEAGIASSYSITPFQNTLEPVHT